MEKGYVITNEELIMLIDKASDGTLSKTYDIEQICKIIDNYYISKSKLCGIYFDDIINSLETKEEVDKYVTKLINEWE